MYGLRATLQEEAIKSKISEEDRRRIEDEVQKVLDWLQKNEMAEQEEFEYRLKEVEAVCSPIITKLYQQGGPGGGAGAAGAEGMGGMPGMGAGGGGGGGGGGGQGPKVEEVD